VKFARWYNGFMKKSSSNRWLIAFLVVLISAAGYYLYRRYAGNSPRNALVFQYLSAPDDHRDWQVKAGDRCPEAPFSFPTTGFIGYLWGDTFKAGHPHQGLDFFGGENPGITPVIAVSDGYLTRMESWKSSLILRIPVDPLHPERQIWVYYTHLADPSGKSYILTNFPAGTSEVFIKRGTPLGYQGNYSGDPGNPVGVHLHLSIVQDDGRGKFKNELDIRNTYDPSPYFGMPLSLDKGGTQILTCGVNQKE
jgi:hypothetical protein